MDWRTSNEQPDTENLRTLGTDHLRARPLAGIAGAALLADGFGRFALEPALTRDLQVARAAGGRFGANLQRDGVSE